MYIYNYIYIYIVHWEALGRIASLPDPELAYHTVPELWCNLHGRFLKIRLQLILLGRCLDLGFLGLSAKCDSAGCADL